MKYEHVTFTMSLPRSRTKWMAEIVKPWAASYHDPLVKHRSIESFAGWLDETILIHPDKPILIADTISVFFFDRIVERFPGARFMFLWREPRSVIDSLHRMDPEMVNDDAIWEQWQALQEARESVKRQRLHGTSFDFVDLCHAAHVMRAINFVLSPVPFSYAYGKARQIIVADHEKAKRETDPAIIRALFATRGVSQ